MSEYKQVTLKKAVFKPDDNPPIFSESATHIEITDEGGGPFIILSQSTDDGKDQQIRLDGSEELNFISKVAEEMMAEYKVALL